MSAILLSASIKVTTLLAFLILIVATTAYGQENTEAASLPNSGYIEANGINYYYEIHGEGEPLLLLHGGLGSIDMFGPILPALTENRQVIGVDLHGHGRTELGDRPINRIDIGDDLAVILNELDYEQVDVLGYSFGGMAAFRLAVQHPEKVRRLVILSFGFASDGFFPDIQAQISALGADAAEMMRDTPMYQSYAAVAPHPEEFPQLLQGMGDLMLTPYNWRDDVPQLTMPVMLVFGDSDMYRLEHIVEFYQLLGGGLQDAGWMRENMSQNRLAILPNLTHYDIFFAPEMVATVLPFLNGENVHRNWADHVE